MSELLQDLVIYGIFAALFFGIGLTAGYILLSKYYQKRFIAVATQCSDEDSLVPLLKELDRES